MHRSLLRPLATASVFLSLLAFAPPSLGDDGPESPFEWLEEVEGERALTWVRAQNAASNAELTKHPEFAKIEADTLAVLQAQDRIVFGEQHGEHMYNFWRDATHSRGLYRRASIASYVAGKPEWETLLDLDALAEKEGKNWVWKGMTLRRPDYARGIARLSIGGSDAVVIREFDLPSKSFVADGFQLPESKGGVGWLDADTVYVDTNFGEGSLTDSGYPRIVKRWKRGTPVSEAHVVFEAPKKSVWVGAYRSHYGEAKLDWVDHGTSFYTSEKFLLEGDQKTAIDVPNTARIHTLYQGQVFIELKKDWKIGETVHVAGSVVAIPLADLKAGKKTFTPFFTPTASTSLQSIERTKSFLLVRVMTDVRDELFRYQLADGKWDKQQVPFDGIGTIWTSSVDPDRDTFFASHSSFLQPTTLFHVDASALSKKLVQQAPKRFDATPYVAEQQFAQSKDGTRVPYFLVRKKDLTYDGKNRTLLYGYGGFRISMRPRYMGASGKNWLDRGGVYVLSNIRGGAEYGPNWHSAALKANRPRAFEDFEAIAEDLIAKKITSPKYLGIRGGSNGGLLVGAAFTRRPDLFGAVVCQVPLLDMRRYNQLLAGASWMAEYGNPDVPEEWSFIKTWSPYHNVSPTTVYPRVLFTTSTRDDRVHPGHARKMVALMKWLGHPVLYYENTEGGHAGAANAKQRAYSTALVTTYLLTELGD